MQLIGHFTGYTPDRTEKTAPLIDVGALFLKDENGADWYDIAHQQWDGYCIAVKDGCVIASDADPSKVFPADCDVYVADSAAEIGQVLADGVFTDPHTTANDVNAERQRRVVVGKVIDGVYVTGRDVDARNLTNLYLTAQLRIAGGDTTTLTTYRDGNNVDHELTPPQVLSLWQQSASYVSDLYKASWRIKAMDPLPEDVTADELWPA